MRVLEPEVLTPEKPYVNVVVISDPVRFLSGDSSVVERRTIPYTEGLRLNDYLGTFFPNVHPEFTYEVAVNGKAVAEYDRPFTPVIPGDFVSFCPTMQGGGGGGGGKNPLKMVAMLAVMVVATYFGQWYAYEYLGMAQGSLAGAAVAGTASFVAGTVGGFVVNAMFPTGVLNKDGLTGSDLSTTPTYAWDVQSNPDGQDQPIPVLYGKMRIIPPIVGKYVSIDGSKQYLNLLLCITEGQIKYVGDILINNNPIETYQDVTYEIRTGANVQDVIPDFSSSYFDNPVGVKLSTNFFLAQTSGNTVNEVGVTISFPNGLSYANNSGGLDAQSVTLELQYQKQGDSAWVDFPESPSTITAADRSTLRYYYRVSNLPSGKYNVRVRRTTPTSTVLRVTDSCYYDYLQEVVNQQFSFPNRSLIAVRALATDQLSGGLPKISMVAERADIQVWNPKTTSWEAKPSSVPAWVAWDILHNSWYGADVLPEHLLNNEFLNWEDWCSTKGLTCNIYFSGQMTIPEALNQIGTSGRAVVIPKGCDYGVIVNRPTRPTGMYTVGNIIKNSFKVNYMDMQNRANVIEIVYNDKDKDWSKQSFEKVSPNFNELEDPIVKQSITLYATDNRQEAVNYAQHLLNCNIHHNRTVTIKVSVDGIHNQAGDVVWIQHHVPYWGRGGRVLGGTLNSVSLPFTVSFDSSPYSSSTQYNVGDVVSWMGVLYRCIKQTEIPSPVPTDLQWWSPAVYGVLLRHNPDVATWDADHTYSDLDYAEYENYLYVSNVDNNKGTIPSSDILKWTPVGDIYEEKVVTNTSASTSTLQVSTNFMKAPQKGDIFAFGVIGKEAKKFRIISIDKDGDLIGTITSLEYRDEVFESDQEIPPYPSETSMVEVSNLSANENWQSNNGIGSSTIELSWNGYVGKWKVYQRELLDGTPTTAWVELGTTSDKKMSVYNLIPGKTYQWSVVSYIKSSADAGSKVSASFIGHPPLPHDVENLSISVGHLGFVLSWSLDLTPWVSGYDVSNGVNILEQGYSGDSYLVKQSLETGTYTFLVRARDVFGQVGYWTSVSYTLEGPSACSGLMAVNIAEFVMLYWNPPTPGVLPVDKYEIKRGVTWADSTNVGFVSSPYAQVTELQSGTLQYWVAAIDTNGNYGPAVSLTVSVAGPSGYILHSYTQSDFHSGTPTNLCLYGPGDVAIANFTDYNFHLRIEAFSDTRKILLESVSGDVILESSGYLIGENISTIDDTYEVGDFLLEDGSKYLYEDGYHWSYDGHPELTPTIPVNGGYEEIFDAGAIVTNSKISISENITHYNGGVGIKIFVSTKVAINDAWSSELEGTLFMKASFRYIKVRFQFTSDTVAYSYLNNFSVKVEAKEVSDWGTGVIPVGVGYVDVPLNKTFFSVENIVATPQGSTARFCVAPKPATNPTSIRVYMFEGSTGLPTTTGGTFSWTATGYN